MTPQDQEFLRADATADRPAVIGDCVRASIASLLDLSRDDVPHFAASAHCWSFLDMWLEGRGLVLVELDPRVRPECFCLASGPTERSIGRLWLTHMVVMRGMAVAHDPHPSRAGLLAVTCLRVVVPLAYLGVIR